MSYADDNFLQELREAFGIEAHEHVQSMTDMLLQLEKNPSDAEGEDYLENAYRSAHSIKGAARAVNMNEIEMVAHALESAFTAIRKSKAELRPDDFDLLQQTVDLLGSILDEVADDLEIELVMANLEVFANRLMQPPGQEPPAPAQEEDLAEGVEPEPESEAEAAPDEGEPEGAPGPEAVETESVKPEPAKAKPAKPAARAPGKGASGRSQAGGAGAKSHAGQIRAAEETMRVAVTKLDAFLLKAEGMLFVRQAIQQRGVEVREMVSLLAQWKKDWEKLSARLRRRSQNWRGVGGCSSDGGDDLRDAFIDKTGDYIDTLQKRLDSLTFKLRSDHRTCDGMIDDLLGDAKRLLMVPFSLLSTALHKTVRSLCRDQGKEADFTLTGEHIAIDKRILEMMKDPLTHLLRNCVDHGLERPEDRKKAKKPTKGSITVKISETEGDKVEILVSDDGKGIDMEAVVRSSQKSLGLDAEELSRLSEEERRNLIFTSGVSTSKVVTDVSGRGIGMAIVLEAVERLGGRVRVKSQPGVGTSFHIVLPLTLATFRGALIRSMDRLFIIPTANIERAVRIKASEIWTAENSEMVTLGGKPVSLIRLSEVLRLPPPAKPVLADEVEMSVLVLGAGRRSVAVGVDEIIEEQEILLKGLGKHLAGLRNIAGATILGSGAIVPVLNTADLLETISESFEGPSRRQREVGTEEGVKTVLVVEDSLTSRALLKNIIESVGYEVRTAVDGLDGLNALRSGPVDLVVLDIDMPRMNGFELTEAIRADAQLKELPIVLVTARSTREDMEKGVELGANAYIVKSSFDQTNLVDVIQQFI